MATDSAEQTALQPRSVQMRRAGGGAAAIVLLVVLGVGIQLGGLPWRYRKQLWQFQGGLVGLAVGFVLGRLSRRLPPEP